MGIEKYEGEVYWDYPQIIRWCHSFARNYSDWVCVETIGVTREGRPILLLTLGNNSGISPTLWLDGGTHASEWTGVMATIYSLSKWGAELETKEGKTLLQSAQLFVRILILRKKSLQKQLKNPN